MQPNGAPCPFVQAKLCGSHVSDERREDVENDVQAIGDMNRCDEDQDEHCVPIVDQWFSFPIGISDDAEEEQTPVLLQRTPSTPQNERPPDSVPHRHHHHPDNSLPANFSHACLIPFDQKGLPISLFLASS